MPFALLFIGMILIITGFQNTYSAFGQQVQKDFTGSGSFIYWLAAIGIVGALGYIKDLQGFSRVFMLLIVVALFLEPGNNSLFANLKSGLSAGSTTPVNPVGTPLPAENTGSASSGGSSSGSTFGVSNSTISTGASIVSAIGSFL